MPGPIEDSELAPDPVSHAIQWARAHWMTDSLVVAAAANDPIGKSLAPSYYVGFGLSCAASLLAVTIKIKLVAFKLRKRRSKIGKGGNSPSAKAPLQIKEQIDGLKLQTKCAYTQVSLPTRLLKVTQRPSDFFNIGSFVSFPHAESLAPWHCYVLKPLKY